MARLARIPALLALINLFALTGCVPLGLDADAALTGLTGRDVSGDQQASGSTGTAVADDLTARFPACREPALVDEWRAEVLRLVNVERTSRGLSAVVPNATLEEQATQYACELIQWNFFAHVNPVTQSTLADRADEFGYTYLVIGENLAAGHESPAEVIQAWMDSPGHRDNILDRRFIELGVGVRIGGTYGTYWVQEFGLPLRANPAGTPAK